MFLVIFLWHFCFSNETEQVRVWIGVSGEEGEIWEGLMKEKTIRIYSVKMYIQFKKEKLMRKNNKRNQVIGSRQKKRR